MAKDNLFIPIAQETFGSWGPAGLELLKEIGTRTIIASGNKRARANLFQNVSMAMIRGNIINVKSTLPPLNNNQEFLFLNYLGRLASLAPKNKILCPYHVIRNVNIQYVVLCCTFAEFQTYIANEDMENLLIVALLFY